MNQPLYSECTGEIIEPPQPALEPTHSEWMALWFWAGLIGALLLVEIIATKTGRRTPSQVLKKHTGKILKFVGLVGFAVLGWHLFFGGPL